MYALLSGPSVTVPSVATRLTSSMGCSPPANTQTPASWASRVTACAASATSGRSSSGNVIAPSSNEIRYRVTSRSFLRGLLRPHLTLLGYARSKRLTNHRRLIAAPADPGSFFRGHSRTLAQATVLLIELLMTSRGPGTVKLWLHGAGGGS